ncbi:Fe-S biogenesis protein NfuA [Orbaceae bacterium ESL0721]|nr:Fe-S biogenesis protein NfuA [Orbaceae bacterium ESL0721]
MSIITISTSAQEHFKNLLKNQAEGTQIRVFVMNPGTIGAECGVSYCPADTIEESDIEEKQDGFSVYIDELSAPFLEEATIDYVTDELGTQLTLKAPNSKMKRVADDAPLIERVNYAIQATINPQLAGHGGHVSLVELTDDNYVVLQFGGGCNGCSMVDYTLKEGIEKQLLTEFPELAGVRDVTEHQAGTHSYY